MQSEYNPIRRIRLKRFRSMEWTDVELDNPSFLVGKNGAGKSNFLKALEFLKSSSSLPLDAVFSMYGGIETVRFRTGGKSRPGNFGIRIDFETPETGPGFYAFEIKAMPNYEFSVVCEQCVVGKESFTRDGRGLRMSTPGIVPKVESNALCLPLLGGLEAFSSVADLLGEIEVFSIEPRAIQELQEPDSGLRLKPDGSNLASVLKSMDANAVSRLCQSLEKLVPGVTNVRPVKHGKRLTLKFEQSWKNEKETLQHNQHEAYAMSDGTLRLLGILCAFLQKNPPRVIALEEPESTIHPEALSSLLDLIRSFSRKTQIIVTTHSPELLDSEWIGPENIRIVFWEQGTSHIRPISEDTARSLREHLMGAGEMMRREGFYPTEIFDRLNPDQGELFSNIHD